MLSLRSRLTALTELSEDERENDSHMTSQEEEDARRHRKRERKRRRIVRELFESEKAYIHHLELIHKHFDFPLRFACIIPEDVHARLFSNLEQILRVNRQLLEELEQSSVGLAFLHLGPFLKLYSTYANDHEQALATLQEWQRKSSDFANFVRSQEERPEVRGLKLNALLITPVQRVPRYQMLLEDLLEHTSAEHHDYNDLAEATKQIRSVAWHINEHIRQHENFEKMLEIQNRLSGSAPRILAPGRLFIKEGCLKKVSRKGGRSFERMFFLFSDMLLYAKPKPLDSGRKTFTCCCVLPLKHCKIEPVFGKTRKGQQGGMFRVTCQNESLLLYSTEPGVVNEWTEELVTAVSRFNKNRRTLRKPSSNKVPMRGSGKLTPKKPDKTDTTTLKRPLESVAEETTSGSPCLKDSLHPMRLHLSALKEIDLTNCMSPRKRARNEVPLYEQTPERGEENLAMDRRDLEAVPSTPGNAKLSVTLGSMELTEESLTDGQLDMSADFLADRRDHSRPHIAPRLPIHSVVGEPDSPTESVCDSPCDTSRFYTHIKHRVKQRPKSVDNAAENCMMGFQSAYNNLKTPVTSRCVIL